jgi:sensor histidine kinase YesM
LRERELQASRLETEVSRARLDALQRQLHPHFLFNTLNSISVLMQKNEIETANRMLGDLSELLRQVLSSDAVMLVPLREEMEFVRRYTEIERIRFGDRLDVVVDTDDAALGCPVPGFLLQSLVENAIRHGIARKPEGGTVTIAAQRNGQRLRMEVRDTGVGLDRATNDGGIGIANAQARLRHLYGDKYTLELRNADGGGTLAVVEIPIVEQSFNGDTHDA